MSFVTTIIPAVSVVALFWILHVYAVRRARYLVRIELESFSENMAEKEEVVDSINTSQVKDAKKVSPKKQTAGGVKSHQIHPNDQTAPSMAMGTAR